MNTPQLRSPILLIHGFMGYDEVRWGPWRLAQYFGGIPEFLRGLGNRVLVPRLSPMAGIAARAQQLKVFLDRHFPEEPVHLIAHSMGGLDSRFLISRLGMASRVLSLTTIGTPHRGSLVADWSLRRLIPLLFPFMNWLNLPHQGILDLTTARCRVFNEQVPDAPGVKYFSVAGRFQGRWLQPEWHLPRMIIRPEGPNDGLVSVASASYGSGPEIWEGDHLNLVNLRIPFVLARGQGSDRTADFGRLIQRLADEGF